MRKSVALLPFLLCSLAFGQIGSNSITVTASNNTSLQPDQAVFGITVQSGVSTGLDDVLTALQGSGITIANFSGVTTVGQVVFSTLGSVPPTSPLTLGWGFNLPVPITNTKATVASLTMLEQNIAKQNNGLTLSFSIVGTQVSQQLAQSQTCSLSSLMATASTEAQSLASAANLTVGRILALSSSTSIGVSNTGAIVGVFGSVSFSTVSAAPPPCAITVKFALTGY
jgi:hypothetical protein